MLTKSIVNKFSKLGFSLCEDGKKKTMSRENKNIRWYDQAAYAICLQVFTDKQEKEYCPHSDTPMGCYVDSLKQIERILANWGV